MLFFKAYGLIYSGLPTLIAYLGFDESRFAKPKSAIFATLSFIRMFAGFKSRCKKPASAIALKPLTMSLKIGIASS
jgi:hypothetical protein